MIKVKPKTGLRCIMKLSQSSYYDITIQEYLGGDLVPVIVHSEIIPKYPFEVIFNHNDIKHTAMINNEFYLFQSLKLEDFNDIF
jgi:hypothetical protein